MNTMEHCPDGTLHVSPTARGAMHSGLHATQDFLVRLLDQVAAWQDRAAARRRLASLDDRMLHDIGIDRATADTEATKPFWRR